MAGEADLMTRYCDGDADAFRELYSRIAPRLVAYLIRMCGERATAEDLVQQTFLKVHRARSAYVRGADPVPWMFAIAHRTFLDEVRRRKRARVQVASGSATIPPRSHAGVGISRPSTLTLIVAIHACPAIGDSGAP